jgi:general nucleoside transport system permease protein
VTTVAPEAVSRSARRRPSVRLPEGAWSVLGVVVSMGFLAPLMAIAGQSISRGYSDMISASFGSEADIGFLLLASVPLILVGLGVALPLRAGLFNLGGEGQLLAGAVAAAWLAAALPGFASVPGSFVLLLLFGAIVGAIPGAIAGVLRATRNVSEVVTTLMLNFIVLFVSEYLVSGPLEPAHAVYPATATVPLDYQLKAIGANSLIPVGFVIAVVVAVAVWVLTEFTRTGWRQRLLGLNPGVALRQGIRLGRERTIALAAGGALAGLGGVAELLGDQFRVGYNFSPGWGFDAIVIALLARANALAVIPFALYFGFLRNGSLSLQQNLHVSPDLVLVMGGAPIILVAAIIGFRTSRRWVRTGGAR